MTDRRAEESPGDQYELSWLSSKPARPRNRALRARQSAYVAAGRRAAGGSSDELVAQIESTRANLAQTIDALAERVSPSAQARLVRGRISAQLARPQVQAGGAAAGALLAGLILLRARSHRRHR